MTVVFAAGAGATLARPAGAEDPRFREAVELWLTGEDLPALTALSGLSHEGNRAAQILLGRIEVRAIFAAHLTAGMPRAERMALMRKPGGLSGQSWLAEAAADDPLALAFVAADRRDERAGALAVLLAAGETDTALKAAEAMIWAGQATDADKVLRPMRKRLPAHGQLIADLARAMRGQAAYVGSARMPALPGANGESPAGMVWMQPNPRALVEDAALRKRARAAVGKVEPWTPVRTFCQKHCVSDVPGCTVMGVALMWDLGALPLGSPAESLIPNTTYWASPRMEADIVRAIRDLRDLRDVSAVDTCFVATAGKMQRTLGARNR